MLVCMMKQRLDKELMRRGIVPTRSQAEHYIRLGDVTVNGQPVHKAGTMVGPDAVIELRRKERYVSRAGLKLASVAAALQLSFSGRVVLDVGSSTGGFTDYALQHGARRVHAVDVGTDQLHPGLRGDPRISLHEKTDIRDFTPDETPDIVVIDVSFISVRQILPHIATLCGPQTTIVVMVKPQFEAERRQLSGSGVVKNNAVRRQILTAFEQWARQAFLLLDKRDSEVAGARGNIERFYALRVLQGKDASFSR